ncbi:MAG: EscU/YscU/HrcU family type III secretion system export apparatus switch protein, partial [Planctomycetota bacterium]
QEVQEELKRLEGDPEIKRRRRRIQRNLALQRMMAAVPKAAVVITNPTELAIALEYDPKEHDAPRVIAKGAGYVAERIRDVAGENGIPIVRKPELAQLLFRTVEVGRTIPVDLYKAVADILAYVYRITGRTVSA